jgi:hypothetical protein
VEIRADVGALLAAGLAGEQRLDIGQPDVIGPSIGVKARPMAAVIVRAIDQDSPNASPSHLGESNLLIWAGEGGHAPLKREQYWRASRATDCVRIRSLPQHNAEGGLCCERYLLGVPKCV